MSSINLAVVVMVDLCLRMPPWFSLSSSLTSKKFEICVCIILSASLSGNGNNETGHRLLTSVGSLPPSLRVSHLAFSRLLGRIQFQMTSYTLNTFEVVWT